MTIPCRITHYTEIDEKTGTSKDDMILEDLISTNIMQRGVGNINAMKMARCIIELERIKGIKHGNNQHSLENNFTSSTQTDLAYEENIKDKTLLLTKWSDISNKIEIEVMQNLRSKYKRYIISNNCNINICLNDKEFMTLWDKYLGYSYKKELEHINKILTEGGFYVFEGKREFIATIGKRDFNSIRENFKTIIFDGSALMDGQYDAIYSDDENESEVRFLNIENTRTYENLKINIYRKHKINKQQFREKTYLINGVAEFIKNKSLKGFNRDYVVTYSEQALKLSELLGESTLKSIIPRMDDDRCYYFGNTKGSNEMGMCTRMMQIGWDTLPDYEYAIQWLCCSGIWENLLKVCSNVENSEKYSEMLEFKERSNDIRVKNNTYGNTGKNYSFGFYDINIFKWQDIVSRFYQEIHRTRLRDYSYQDDITVYLFNNQSIIFNMISQLLPKCKMINNNEELSEFIYAKDKSRKKANGTKTAKQKIIDFLDNVKEGQIIKVADILKDNNINSKRWEKLKKEKSIENKINSEFTIVKKGSYEKVS